MQPRRRARHCSIASSTATDWKKEMLRCKEGWEQECPADTDTQAPTATGHTDSHGTLQPTGGHCFGQALERILSTTIAQT